MWPRHRAVEHLPHILVDASSLRGESGFRGIGRYIYDLLYGLAATEREWSPSMRISVLRDIAYDPRRAVSTDLIAAAEDGMRVPRIKDWPLTAKRWLLLGRITRAVGADVVHLTQARGVPFYKTIPRVVTCHDLIPLHYPREYLPTASLHASRYLRELHRFRTATRVVAISERSREDLALLHVRPERIDVVPNGIDLRQWSPEPKPADAARLAALGLGDTPFVVYVGFCDPRKNVPVMLRALAEARRNARVVLAWAGELPRRTQRRMFAQAKAAGLEKEAMRLLGFVSADDLALLYRHARALVFLSRREGFGLPVAEAMASGCPAIVARASGSDDVAGDAGVVLDADDVRGAAAAIARLSSNPEERARLAAAGLERVKKFGREEMARGYVRVWERVASEAKG
jgi:alpha-1,3-rhamnosyl/mannosyltransferase